MAEEKRASVSYDSEVTGYYEPQDKKKQSGPTTLNHRPHVKTQQAGIWMIFTWLSHIWWKPLCLISYHSKPGCVDQCMSSTFPIPIWRNRHISFEMIHFDETKWEATDHHSNKYSNEIWNVSWYDSLQDKEIWTLQPSAGNNTVPANLKSRGEVGDVEKKNTWKQRIQTTLLTWLWLGWVKVNK